MFLNNTFFIFLPNAERTSLFLKVKHLTLMGSTLSASFIMFLFIYWIGTFFFVNSLSFSPSETLELDARTSRRDAPLSNFVSLFRKFFPAKCKKIISKFVERGILWDAQKKTKNRYRKYVFPLPHLLAHLLPRNFRICIYDKGEIN